MANEMGRNVPNTIGQAPITFAMIELADPADCNSRKSQWRAYGFKDVTPTFGAQSTVPTIDGSMTANGRAMMQQMAGVSADWFMISGHHGALYHSDYDSYTTDGQPCNEDHTNLDWDALYNGEQYCGFFNESYHETYWSYAKRDHHDPSGNATGATAAAVANAVYLRTTDAAPSSIAPPEQDNAVFDTTAWAPEPKGIIVSACNTLSYKAARKAWSGYFPNAVIIGTTCCINLGTQVTNAIAAAAMTNQQFWRDPQSVLDQDGMCVQLMKQLNTSYSTITIGLLYKKKFYEPSNDPQDVE